MNADGQETAPGGDTSTQGFIFSPELLSPRLGVVSTRTVHHSCWNCPLIRRKHIKMPLPLFLLFFQARISSFIAKKLLFNLILPDDCMLFLLPEPSAIHGYLLGFQISVSIQSSVEMRHRFL